MCVAMLRFFACWLATLVTFSIEMMPATPMPNTLMAIISSTAV